MKPPAIQLAHLSGFSPIIATASTHNAAYVESLGVTHVVDRTAPLVDAVKAVTAGPIPIVFDAIGASETQDAAWQLLAPNGTLILVATPSINEKELENGRQHGKETAHVFGSVWDKSQGDLGVDLYKHLTAALESGDIKVRAFFLGFSFTFSFPFFSGSVFFLSFSLFLICSLMR